LVDPPFERVEDEPGVKQAYRTYRLVEARRMEHRARTRAELAIVPSERRPDPQPAPSALFVRRWTAWRARRLGLELREVVRSHQGTRTDCHPSVEGALADAVAWELHRMGAQPSDVRRLFRDVSRQGLFERRRRALQSITRVCADVDRRGPVASSRSSRSG
jgi:hypothetical protein